MGGCVSGEINQEASLAFFVVVLLPTHVPHTVVRRGFEKVALNDTGFSLLLPNSDYILPPYETQMDGRATEVFEKPQKHT